VSIRHEIKNFNIVDKYTFCSERTVMKSC